MTAAELRSKTNLHGILALSPVRFQTPDGTVLVVADCRTVATYAAKEKPTDPAKLASIPELIITLAEASK